MQRSDIDMLIESRETKVKKRDFVCGVGVYDVNFQVAIRIDGKQYNHRAYSVWADMLRRCFSPDNEKWVRNYANCTVANEWRRFSAFLAFWKTNYRDGYQLDKDLLHPGNKIYSPERCVFIPQALNTFTTDHAFSRGKYPQGVCHDKRSGKFRAEIMANGKKKHLGLFATALEAHLAWHTAKVEQAQDWKSVCDEIHPRLFDGLLHKIEIMQFSCVKEVA